MPHLETLGHVVAPDLIGMGESDKPDIGYRFRDHYSYLEGFINKKFGADQKNLTLVIHDWGSALGFHFASQNADRIKGIGFMEAITKPLKWSEFPADFKIGIAAMRAPGIGYVLVQVFNMFVEGILPQSIVRTLKPEEKAAYRAPFSTIASRKPTYIWPNEIPIDGYPKDNHDIVTAYHEWLKTSDKIPKIMFVAEPGGSITPEYANWVETNIPHVTRVDIGDGLHFVQEDNPHLIGEKLAEWYRKL